MNSSQISAFIENPSLISVNDVDALKNLANEYSYSETIQLLYLYAVSKHADMKFDEALVSTAYRITNRERILELLGEPTEAAFIEDVQQKETVETVESLPESIIEEPVQQTEKEETVIEFVVDEPAIHDEIIEATKAVVEEKDALDELIYNTTATALEQDYLSSQGMNTVDETEGSIEIIPEKDETIDQPEEKDVISEDSKMSFTSWLHQNHTTEVKKDVSPEQKHKEEIIDRFIETQPSISKPSAEFYSASKKAKESLDANRNPVSETLAKIYEAQGNYQKAIHVYHQLILNYPEKKSLFAPRIEELKNKLSQ